MNCSEIQETLSSYHDGELATPRRATVDEHLDTCADCARSLAEFRALSDLSQCLTDAQPPDALWSAIEPCLDDQQIAGDPSESNPARRQFFSRKIIGGAIAAVVVLVSAGIWLNSTRDDGRSQMEVDFTDFLEQYSVDPSASQNALLTSYEHQAVDLAEAERQLSYRPVATKQLPNGYSLDKVYMIKMPCCTCVQCIYEGENNETLAVFEHTTDQPMWFGKHPAICPCKGRETKIVPFNGQLAASWSTGNRHLTVIGARDLEQVVALIDHFNKSAPAQSSKPSEH